MIFVCPKCGKKIELSVEALIASEYHAVCPQCLTRLQIVGDTAIIPVDIPAVPKPKPIQPPMQQPRESVVKQQPQPTEPVQPVIPAIPAQPKQQPAQQPYYPTSSTQPYYQQSAPQRQVPPPYYPTGSPQPYYQQQQAPQQPKKDNYSCTCTGCMVWGFVLLGIMMLLYNMCNPIFG